MSSHRMTKAEGLTGRLGRFDSFEESFQHQLAYDETRVDFGLESRRPSRDDKYEV